MTLVYVFCGVLAAGAILVVFGFALMWIMLKH